VDRELVIGFQAGNLDESQMDGNRPARFLLDLIPGIRWILLEK
jgi:hypothetical protein